MFDDIRNHVIVISEASSALGVACAELAAQRGARLVLADRDEGALDELGRRLLETDAEVSWIVADPAEPGGSARAMEHALKRYGRMDTWVNRAGIGGVSDLQSVKQLWLWLRNLPVTLSHHEFENALDKSSLS